MPTGSERLIWGFGDEKTLDVVKAEFVGASGEENESVSATLSGTICWENMMVSLLAASRLSKGYWKREGEDGPGASRFILRFCLFSQPLLRNHWYKQGVEIYCAPTVDARVQWESTMRHVAMEGRW